MMCQILIYDHRCVVLIPSGILSQADQPDEEQAVECFFYYKILIQKVPKTNGNLTKCTQTKDTYSTIFSKDSLLS
jgi:hypothetical protein